MHEEVRARGINWLSYKRLVEYHKKFGGRLSLKTFAKIALNINEHNVESSKSDGGSMVVDIEAESEYDAQFIQSIRKEVIAKAKLHIGDLITLPKFKKLYEKFGRGIPEKLFATEVLDMNIYKIRTLLNGSKKQASVFANYVANPEDIAILREKVIRKEKLHIGQTIDYEEFLRLFNKYAGILSQEIFAEEILDINAIGVKNMRVAGSNSAILQDIDVPKDYLEFLKDKVCRKEQLTFRQQFSRDEFYQIYDKYGGVLPERLFATEVLGIPEKSVSNLLLDRNKTRIFYSEDITDFEELRRRVIKQNFLHYGDSINYVGFLELKQKYAPTMSEIIFADKVLDISTKRLANIRNARKYHTQILLNEPLPSDEDILVLKRKILISNDMHIKDKINYAKIQELHRKYGGIMPEYMFADKIFDIGKGKLNSMSRNPDEEAVILTRTKIPIRQLSKLRNKVLGENHIVKGSPVTFENFEKWFTGYKHILSRIMFARGVIGVSKSNYGNLKDKRTSNIKALIDDAPETLPWVTFENPKRNKEKEKQGKEKKVTKKKTLKPSKPRKSQDDTSAKNAAKSILDKYVYTPKNVARVKEYIHSCKTEYERGTFSVSDLPFLYDCIEFAQGGVAEISIYAQIAISFRKYREARRCIFTNSHNDGLSAEDKSKLSEMIKGIDRAISRERAVDMLSSNPDANIRKIMEDTKLSEIEIMAIKRKLAGEGQNPSAREKLFDED